MEFVDVVDENDNVIGCKPRHEVQDNEVIRGTNIFILNSAGEMLLQLRAAHITHYPSHWDCAAGGAVSAGEDYETNAHREMFEEIGVECDLKLLGKQYIERPDGGRRMGAFFTGVYDGEITIDPAEVQDAKFFSFEEIRDMISRGEKMHPELLFGLQKFFF